MGASLHPPLVVPLCTHTSEQAKCELIKRHDIFHCLRVRSKYVP